MSAGKELKECASLELLEFDRVCFVLLASWTTHSLELANRSRVEYFPSAPQLCTVTQALAQRRNFEHNPPEPAFEEVREQL